MADPGFGPRGHFERGYDVERIDEQSAQFANFNGVATCLLRSRTQYAVGIVPTHHVEGTSSNNGTHHWLSEAINTGTAHRNPADGSNGVGDRHAWEWRVRSSCHESAPSVSVALRRADDHSVGGFVKLLNASGENDAAQ